MAINVSLWVFWSGNVQFVQMLFSQGKWMSQQKKIQCRCKHSSPDFPVEICWARKQETSESLTTFRNINHFRGRHIKTAMNDVCFEKPSICCNCYLLYYTVLHAVLCVHRWQCMYVCILVTGNHCSCNLTIATVVLEISLELCKLHNTITSIQ